MSFRECIAACNSPASTAARIWATNAPPLPPCGSNFPVWSISPVVSNLTISTAMPGAARTSCRAISSVWTSAMTLLRVPMRMAVTNFPSMPQQCASARILQDHIRSLFVDHDGRRIGIARHQVRHDGGVDDAQALDAAHLEELVDHGERIVAHPAGRGRMIDRRAGLAAEGEDVILTGDLGAGIDFFRHVILQRWLRQDAAQNLDAVNEGAAIGARKSVV